MRGNILAAAPVSDGQPAVIDLTRRARLPSIPRLDPHGALAEPVAFEVSADDRARQLAAVAEYASQLVDLFPPDGRFEHAYASGTHGLLWWLPSLAG